MPDNPTKNVYRMSGVMIAIKPLSELPDNPTHNDFSGTAIRMCATMTGDREKDECMIMGLCRSAVRIVCDGQRSDDKVSAETAND